MSSVTDRTALMISAAVDATAQQHDHATMAPATGGTSSLSAEQVARYDELRGHGK